MYESEEGGRNTQLRRPDLASLLCYKVGWLLNKSGMLAGSRSNSLDLFTVLNGLVGLGLFFLFSVIYLSSQYILLMKSHIPDCTQQDELEGIYIQKMKACSQEEVVLIPALNMKPPPMVPAVCDYYPKLIFKLQLMPDKSE